MENLALEEGERTTKGDKRRDKIRGDNKTGR